MTGIFSLGSMFEAVDLAALFLYLNAIHLEMALIFIVC